MELMVLKLPKPLPQYVLKFLFGNLLLGCLTLLGQLPTHQKKLRQSPRFENISTEQGLSGSGVACIYQDRQGFMWFGTTDGLNRFDGYQFKVYIHDPRDPASLSENSVTCIHESGDGKLWFGTKGGGLNRFDPSTERFVHFRHDPNDPHSLSHDEVRAIREDRNGYLWIGTSGGLAKHEPGVSEHFVRYENDPKEAGSLSHDSILTIFKDRTGVLWIGTDGGGLNEFDPDSPGPFVHYRHDGNDPNSLSHNRVRAIHQDRKGLLWIGTANGLNRLDLDTGLLSRFYPNANDSHDLSDQDICAIWEDRSGYLWIGTREGGLNKLDPERENLETYQPDRRDPYSLSYRHVTSIYEDRGGVLWFATGEGGVNKLNPAGIDFGHYRLFDKVTGYLPFDVMSIREDSRGKLWVGTPEGLLYFDRNNELVSHYRNDSDKPGSLSNDRVWAIYEDRQGVLWLGTDGGLNRLEWGGAERKNARFTSFPNAPDDPHGSGPDVVVSILEDRSGVLWIGTAGGGLRQFDRESGRFVHVRFDQDNPFSLSNDKVTCILEDRAGLIWIGTYNGLNMFDPSIPKFVAYRPHGTDPRSLSHKRILAIHESQSGVLWVGADGGLNKFDRDDDSFSQYWKKDGLPNDVVYGILEDKSGFLWVSTNSGLARFDPEQETFKAYDAGDGLQKNEFQFGAYFKNAAGKLFFGGVNGLNAFYPDRIKDNPVPPPVVITNFLLFNEPVAREDPNSTLHLPIQDTSEIRLSFEDRVFSFEFAALDYANPQKNRYAYMLEGLDERWQQTDASRRFATYTNLDPDGYVFRVKASNKDGVWNEQDVAIRMTIQPPPWQTWWAYSLYGLVVASLLIGYLWSHRKKLAYERSISEHLDRKVTERTRALEQKNRENLEKQQQLLSQADKLSQQAGKLRQMDELKTRFFTNISHEIRTPLTLALGPLEDVLSENLMPDKPRKKLEMVRRNTRRLEKLIDELLDISKLEAGRMTIRARKVNAVAFLRECTLAFLTPVERKRIILVFQTDREEIPLFIDSDKLEKVFYNLLSNSLKFTPEKGKILVRIDSPDPNFLSISVKDTGPGIPADQLPYVFDRFYQAQGRSSGSGSGSGIGLSLAKELVLIHGGDIEVKSEPGFGCQFVVRLPKGKKHLEPEDLIETGTVREDPWPVLANPTGRSEFEEKNPTPIRPLPPKKLAEAPAVLIVEDHAEVRFYLREHLETLYDVLEAKNGQTGLELALKRVPDLVLSDIMMPGMDGFELCRRLKTDEKTSHIPVILLTALATLKSNIAGLETGADDYLVKPFNAQVLMTRIHNLIETRRKLRERFNKEMILQPAGIPITSSDQAFLQKAIDVLERHMGNSRFGVYELAEELGFSRRQLHRKLTALTGKTPGDFIRQIRLERAAQLLREGAGNVAEIAYAVGFHKPQYFSAMFREVFGKNPSEFASK